MKGLAMLEQLGLNLMSSGHLSTARQMTDWINGFN